MVSHNENPTGGTAKKTLCNPAAQLWVLQECSPNYFNSIVNGSWFHIQLRKVMTKLGHRRYIALPEAATEPEFLKRPIHGEEICSNSNHGTADHAIHKRENYLTSGHATIETKRGRQKYITFAHCVENTSSTRPTIKKSRTGYITLPKVRCAALPLRVYCAAVHLSQKRCQCCIPTGFPQESAYQRLLSSLRA